jgi:DNA-binding transcriptional ArsR family regulator
MPKRSAQLDGVFQALSDPTRRAVLRRLGVGEAPVSELARQFDMALPSFLQHLRMLERSGLVTSRKEGRVRTCELRSRSLSLAEGWLAEQRTLWQQRLDRFDTYLDQMKATPAPKEKK